jgi:hypothetical protein
MRRHHAGLLALAAAAAALFAAPAFAQSEKITMMPDGDPKTVAYSHCPPSEESGECLAYLLSCEPSEAYGDGLELMVIGQGGGKGSKPDITAMARTLLGGKSYGEAKLNFTIGGAPVEVPAHFVLVTSNEMNGDWDLTVRTMDPGVFLDVLSIGAAEQITADVGGYPVQLANGEEDAKVLMKFKEACTQ